MGRRPTGNPRGRPPHPGLTPAEERVLAGLRRGLSNAEIADELGVSWTTVKYHVANVLGKLDAESRRELAGAGELQGESKRARWLPALGLLGRVRARPVIATTAAFVSAAAIAAALLARTAGLGNPPRVVMPAATTVVATPASRTLSVTPTLPAATPTPVPETPTPAPGGAAGVQALLERPFSYPELASDAPCPVTPGRHASTAVASGSGPGPFFGAGLYVPLYGQDPDGGYETRGAWTIEYSHDADTVVIRGTQVDGPGVVEFPGANPTGWTTLDTIRVGLVGNRAFTSGLARLRLTAPGCYAIQFDALTFQQHLVFEVLPPPTSLNTSGSIEIKNPSPLDALSVGVGGAWVGAGTYLATKSERVIELPWSNPPHSWSADGSTLVIANGTTLLLVDRDGAIRDSVDGEFLAADADRTATRLAVTALAGDSLALTIVDVTGGALRAVWSASEGPSWNGAWSPDGRSVAFMTERDRNPEVYVVDRDGNDERRLTDNPEFDGYPTWSPDGTRIAWESTREMRRGIWLMDVDGGDQHQLAPTDDAIDWFPAWSPDGTWLTFVSNRDGGWRIYTMAADGTGVRRLTDGPGSDWAPQWSPDGEWIGFVSNRSGTPEMWVVRPDGSELRRVTTTTGGWVDQFAWAPRPRSASAVGRGSRRRYAGFVNADTSAAEAGTAPDAEVTALRALATLREPRNRFELDDVLEGVAELARRVTSARYGAVTITDGNNHVEGFFVAGLDATALRKLKTPPQGHGPLGTLRQDGRPVNVDDLDQHELSFGFPPKHPAMKSLLGVPIWMHGEVRGTIYVTDKAEVSTFGRWDEEALLVLAKHVSGLIERYW